MLALRMAVSPARAPRPRCTPGALHGRALPPGARAGMHPPLPLPFRTSAAAAAAPAAAAIAAALGPSRRGRPGSRGPGGRAGKGLKGATARLLAIFPGELPWRKLQAEACGSCLQLRGAGAGKPRGRVGTSSVSLRTAAVCPTWPACASPTSRCFPVLGLRLGLASLEHQGAIGARCLSPSKRAPSPPPGAAPLLLVPLSSRGPCESV